MRRNGEDAAVMRENYLGLVSKTSSRRLQSQPTDPAVAAMNLLGTAEANSYETYKVVLRWAMRLTKANDEKALHPAVLAALVHILWERRDQLRTKADWQRW